MSSNSTPQSDSISEPDPGCNHQPGSDFGISPKAGRNLKLLMAATFMVGLSMAMNMALYNNFLKVMLNGEPLKLGQVESFREVPGFLSAFLNGAMAFLPEPISAGICLILMGAGFAGYYWASGIGSLMLWSFISSVGLHQWMPLSGSLGLTLAPAHRRGEILGKITSIGAIGTVLGYFLIAVLAKIMGSGMESFYKYMYFVAGLMAFLGALLIFRVKEGKKTKPRSRLIFKKKYGLFYLLNFLQGCRKQVFVTFATFALVLNYSTGPGAMAVLLFINYLVAFALSPIFGKWIDKFGERKVLSANYLLLVLVFLGYALIHEKYTLYFLYCVDNVMFIFSMALNTYLGKIAPKEDLTGTLAMGITINHIAAVSVPLIGFYAWRAYGYEVCFLFGAVVVFLQFVAAQWVKDIPVKT